MHAKRAAEVSLSGALPESPLGFPAKGSQSAARTDRPPGAGDPHTGGLGGIFSDVHAAGENDLTSFAACGRRTLRGMIGQTEPLRFPSAARCRKAHWTFRQRARSPLRARIVRREQAIRTLADWAVFSPTYMPPEKMISLPSPPAGGELCEA